MIFHQLLLNHSLLWELQLLFNEESIHILLVLDVLCELDLLPFYAFLFSLHFIMQQLFLFLYFMDLIIDKHLAYWVSILNNFHVLSHSLFPFYSRLFNDPHLLVVAIPDSGQLVRSLALVLYFLKVFILIYFQLQYPWLHRISIFNRLVFVLFGLD